MESEGGWRRIFVFLAQLGASPAVGLLFMVFMGAAFLLAALPVLAVVSGIFLFGEYALGRQESSGGVYGRGSVSRRGEAKAGVAPSRADAMVTDVEAGPVHSEHRLAAGRTIIPVLLACGYSEETESIYRRIGRHAVAGVVIVSKCAVTWLSSYAVQLLLRGVLVFSGSAFFDGAGCVLGLTVGAGLAAIAMPGHFRGVLHAVSPVLCSAGLALWAVGGQPGNGSTAPAELLGTCRVPIALAAIALFVHRPAGHITVTTRAASKRSPGIFILIAAHVFKIGLCAVLIAKARAADVLPLLSPHTSPNATAVCARALCALGLITDICTQVIDLRNVGLGTARVVRVFIEACAVIAISTLAYAALGTTGDGSASWVFLVRAALATGGVAVPANTLLRVGAVLWGNRPVFRTVKSAALVLLAGACLIIMSFAAFTSVMLPPPAEMNRVTLTGTEQTPVVHAPLISDTAHPLVLSTPTELGRRTRAYAGARHRKGGRHREARRTQRNIASNSNTHEQASTALQNTTHHSPSNSPSNRSKQFKETSSQNQHVAGADISQRSRSRSITTENQWPKQYPQTFVSAEDTEPVVSAYESSTADMHRDSSIENLMASTKHGSHYAGTCIPPPFKEFLQKCRLVRGDHGEYFLFLQISPSDALEVVISPPACSPTSVAPASHTAKGSNTVSSPETGITARTYTIAVNPLQRSLRTFFKEALAGHRPGSSLEHLQATYKITGTTLQIRAQLSSTEAVEIVLDLQKLSSVANAREAYNPRLASVITPPSSLTTNELTGTSAIQDPYCTQTETILRRSCFVVVDLPHHYSVIIFPEARLPLMLTWQQGVSSMRWFYIDCSRMLSKAMKDLLCPQLLPYQAADALVRAIYAQEMAAETRQRESQRAACSVIRNDASGALLRISHRGKTRVKYITVDSDGTLLVRNNPYAGSR